jgi:hypothetical protein
VFCREALDRGIESISQEHRDISTRRAGDAEKNLGIGVIGTSPSLQQSFQAIEIK